MTDFADDLTRVPRPGRYRGQAAPFDESPTVAILERFRDVMRRPNGRPADDGGFAESFLRNRRNRA